MRLATTCHALDFLCDFSPAVLHYIFSSSKLVLLTL